MDKVEMDVIMQERIKKFNQYVMSLDIDKIPIGLFSGKMGICIYFYQQARLAQNKEYEKFAEKLLISITKQVNSTMPIDLENGLAGICYGSNYLINEKFVSGNINSILKEMENKIFNMLNFHYLSSNFETTFENLRIILEASFYILIRVEKNKLSKNEKYIYQNLLIKVINKIEDTKLQEKFKDPIYFSLISYFFPLYLIFLSRVYVLNIYNYKIDKIFDELSDRIKSTYPLLLSNRLFFSGAIRRVEEVKTMPGWKDHINLLEQNIDISTAVKNEFRNKKIFPDDGLTGLEYMLRELHGHLTIDYDVINNRVISSEIWDDFLENNENHNPIGLVFGMCGVITIYQAKFIKKDEN
jgi:hypothetical protein